MENTAKSKEDNKKSIRLWPGIVLTILLITVRYILPEIAEGTSEISLLGGLVLGLFVLIWWMFFSQGPRIERIGPSIMIVVILVLSFFLTHKSIRTGMQGMMYFIYAIPILAIAFVLAVSLGRRVHEKTRCMLMRIAIVFSAGVWLLFQSTGISGEGAAHFKWRWSKTAEEELLAQTQNMDNKEIILKDSVVKEAEWSGFRGNNRDGIVLSSQITTNWNSNPPKKNWRKAVGPGCSSFAVWGSYFYTQEQRGESELVSCYKISDGTAIWQHSDSARFWDSHAGAGPRSTPTIKNGKIYTLGATGILNVLDAKNGTKIWSRKANEDTKMETLVWGFTSSPLIIDNKVIVALSGKLAAYHIDSGKPLWYGPDGGSSYSSPHLLTIDGIPQIILMSKQGIKSFNPSNGDLFWEYDLKGDRIVQPALTSKGDLLVTTGGGRGLCRLSVKKQNGNWEIKEKWNTKGMRPNFNDFVIHKGHAYGFNGLALACVDIQTGERKWKEGRYGGQIILLAEQNLILVLTEKGKIALVEAAPNAYNEIAKIDAIEGKTWNHPVLVNDVLLVRNMEEMAAFDLATN